MYDPYGKPTVLNTVRDAYGYSTALSQWLPRTINTFENEVLYCGYRWDGGRAGHYHVRHRVYHPTLGRWTARDPIGYADGGVLYAYSGANPVNYTDHSGLLRDVGFYEALSDAGAVLLNRLFGRPLPYMGATYPHPTTGGPVVSLGGAACGGIHAWMDRDEPFTVQSVAANTAPYLGPAAVSYGTYVAAIYTGSSAMTAISQSTALLARGGLYGAAAYVVVRTYFVFMDSWAAAEGSKLQNLAWHAEMQTARLRGEIAAMRIVMKRPGVPLNVCCGGEMRPITKVDKCSQNLREAWGMASRNMAQLLAIAAEAEARQDSGKDVPDWVTQTSPSALREQASRQYQRSVGEAWNAFTGCLKTNCNRRVWLLEPAGYEDE